VDVSGNTALAALFALLVANYVVTRSSLARGRPWLFWAINAFDALAAVAILMLGFPGIDGRPLVRVMIAMVVLLHLAQNFQAKTRWDAEDRAERLDAELRERQRLAEAESESQPGP
jgi:hypothetical protein